MGSGDFFVARRRIDVGLEGNPEPLNHAIKYIELLTPDVFDKAEIVWEFQVERDNPSAWIWNRFYQPQSHP